MDPLNIVIGVILLICFVVFGIYSTLSIRHAARFRYLSARTVYLTVFYVGTCSVLMLLSVLTYVWILSA